MRFPAVLVPFLLASLVIPATAAAETPPAKRARKPPLAAALLCGLATSMLPLGLGATRMGMATDNAGRNAGLGVAGVGVALAPIVSHIVLGEYQRAAAFGAIPVATQIGAISLMYAKPDAVFQGTMGSRTTFALLFSFNLFGSAAGLVDVLLVNDRQKPPPVTLSPVVGAGRYGFVLGGTL